MGGMIRPFVVASLIALCHQITVVAQPQPPAQTPAPPDVAAPPADALKTASGLASKVLQPGTGSEHPGIKNAVTVHYTAWSADGKMFDSSHARKIPSTFLIEAVIKGWAEGVQLMTVGEKRRMWIPEDLAFKGIKGRPQGMVVFEVELIDILPDPRVAPPDVAKPPDDAEKTRSGLASKVLRPGTGSAKPRKESRVTVHYTGWSAQDGKMFDSSVVKGQAATFGLNEVIEGWTEGVQLMVEGERRRFWIPARLAYQGRQGPQGMLVFDIELLAIR
jgi:peptidylprolyl isomerase